MAGVRSQPRVTQIAAGTYRVEHEGRAAIVYVAGPPENRWAFWDGHIYHDQPSGDGRVDSGPRAPAEPLLTAPMPATVVKVLVATGSAVRRGDALIVLEAMKMELAVRAPRDGIVTAVHCREGELVQPERVLIDIAGLQDCRIAERI
jgi:3-methylcrotonyl-CoA carboxylase alpha subunit